jgi:predicted nucleotidyltransferase
MRTQFRELLQWLTQAGVEFIVVGGTAAFAHGASRVTLDLDVVYRRTKDNLERLASAVAPLGPYPRGAPPGLPFKWDRRTVGLGTNFTLQTDLGFIDLLGEITGGGRFEDLLPFAVRLDVYGISCLCLDLSKLIEVKRAAGRPKDFEAIAELELIEEEKRKLDQGIL